MRSFIFALGFPSVKNYEQADEVNNQTKILQPIKQMVYRSGRIPYKYLHHEMPVHNKLTLERTVIVFTRSRNNNPIHRRTRLKLPTKHDIHKKI